MTKEDIIMANLRLTDDNIFARALGVRTNNFKGGLGFVIIVALVIISLAIIIHPSNKDTSDVSATSVENSYKPAMESEKGNTYSVSKNSGYSSTGKDDKPVNSTKSSSSVKSDSTESSIVTSCWLTEFAYLNKEDVIVKDSGTDKTNTGDTIGHLLWGYRDGAEIVFYLGGRYASISGLWTITEAYKDTNVVSVFELYADNELVYISSAKTGGDLPEDFGVNINNCDELKIRFVAADNSAKIANARLNPEPISEGVNGNSTEHEAVGTWLTDLDYLAKEDTIVKAKGTVTTNMGDVYSHCIWGYRDGAEITYYLKGDYSRMTGIWAINSTYRDTSVKSSFDIYADDDLIYSSPLITGGDVPISFDVDIKNCQKLTIMFPTGAHVSANIDNIMIYK